MDILAIFFLNIAFGDRKLNVWVGKFLLIIEEIPEIYKMHEDFTYNENPLK